MPTDFPRPICISMQIGRVKDRLYCKTSVFKYEQKNSQIIIAYYLGNKKSLKSKPFKSEINRSKPLCKFNKTSEPKP